MGWKEDQIDKLLDQFLDGTLTEEEVRLMHETLENGDSITEVELDKIVLPVDILQPNKNETNNVIRQSPQAQNPYRKLEEFKQYKHYQNPIVETSKAYTLVFIIVFFSILVMAPFVYMLLPIHFNGEQIFKNNFSPYPIDDKIERGFNSDIIASFNWKEGSKAYERANYNEAMYFFGELVEEDDNYTDTYIDHFYLGVTNLSPSISDPKTASKHLYNVLDFNSEDAKKWKYPAHWYLALSYIQLNETQNSRIHLKEIIAAGDQAFHYEKALKLLEEL